jgi:hypothetical protein
LHRLPHRISPPPTPIIPADPHLLAILLALLHRCPIQRLRQSSPPALLDGFSGLDPCLAAPAPALPPLARSSFTGLISPLKLLLLSVFPAFIPHISLVFVYLALGIQFFPFFLNPFQIVVEYCESSYTDDFIKLANEIGMWLPLPLS